MSSMSYRKFRNTLDELRACADEFSSEKLSREEHRARLAMLDLMSDILNDAHVNVEDDELNALKERLEIIQGGSGEED